MVIFGCLEIVVVLVYVDLDKRINILYVVIFLGSGSVYKGFKKFYV